MLILVWIAVLSVACNVPLYFMLRYSADPRNQLRISSMVDPDLEIPDLTFDSRGMV